MTHIWRLEGYGVAVESTRGTAVAPSDWIQQTEANFENNVESVMDESALGVLMTTSESVKTKQYSEGSITGITNDTIIGYYLLSALWSVASSETVWTGAYEHTFTMNNTNSKPSLTISKSTPIEDQAFALAMVSAINISGNVWEQMILAADLRAKASTSATLTKNYEKQNKFYVKNATIKFADTVDGLDAADGQCIDSFDIALTQELEDGFCLSSGVDLSDIFNKWFSIDGNISKKKINNTLEGYVNDKTVKAMRIELLDDSVTIGVSDNPTVIIDLSKVTFEDHSTDGGLDDIMMENVNFKAHYDIENQSDIEVKVINTKTSY